MQSKKLALVTIKQHGFYSGINAEEKAVMQSEIVEQYLLLKTKKEYPATHEDAIRNYVDKAMGKGWHSAQLHSGEGDYEVDISDIDYIENL